MNKTDILQFEKKYYNKVTKSSCWNVKNEIQIKRRGSYVPAYWIVTAITVTSLFLATTAFMRYRKNSL